MTVSHQRRGRLPLASVQAASPRSLRRAAAMRKCQRKLKTEVRARAPSQSKELERETGTGAWVIQNDEHAEPRSACFHCGVTPRPLASRPRGHGSHVEAKSVPMKSKRDALPVNMHGFVLRPACFQNARRWVFICFLMNLQNLGVFYVLIFFARSHLFVYV